MYVAIAGNIGSGKTTLATLLARHLGFRAEYEDPTNNPYIFDFYKDMHRWSFNLQIYFLDVRLRQTQHILRSGENVVQDRTLYEDGEIFAPNLMAMGLMNQRDYEAYRNLFDSICELITPPDLMIYLYGSISTLVNQIASRNREYEDSLRMDYLKRLNEYYDAWYKNYQRGKKIAFDVSELNFKDNPNDMGKILTVVQAELYGLFKT